MINRLMKAVTGRVGAIAILLAVAALSGLAFATSAAQPVAEPTDGLPASAQSTRVTELSGQFPSGRSSSAIVVYERQGAILTAGDMDTIARARAALASRASGEVSPPIVSDDKQAALLVVPLPGDPAEGAEADAVDGIRSVVRPTDLPAGLSAQVTGGAAFSRDISAAFDGADITLLLSTAAVVALLLLVTYRSPLLWIIPLTVIGVADQVVASLLPWVAQLVGERTDAAISGIVSVLVFGAGTDYALLLISRYREELRNTSSRRDAMATALRRAAPAIIASAGTVILALLTLLFAASTSNRTLGIAAALGVSVALFFGLVVLPAALVCFPRGIFWPFIPQEGSADPSATGVWSKIAQFVGRRPAAVLTTAVLILAALASGLFGARIGLSQTDQFRTPVESVTAQKTLARHYPAGSSQPATVIVATPTAPDAAARTTQVAGVASIGEPERSSDGSLTQYTVNLTAESGTAEADTTIRALRANLATIPAADALVGGAPAADLDQRDTNLRDNAVIAPLVLAVVLIVLILLLRSLVAPILLLLTVIASYAASLGAAVYIFHLVGIPALDAGVPLLAFLFLVALGVDYNIFLVTRAREETTARNSTRDGTLRALASTGGVITSAGILLAAVFTVLGVLPVIVLTQLGIIVGIGVLLDTLLVRTLVVPAIALLLGERFWWPARPTTPPSQ